VETLATIGKCVAILFFLQSTSVSTLIAFGLAQVLYALILCAGYWMYFLFKPGSPKLFSPSLVTLRRADAIDPSMKSAFKSFSLQAMEKHFLGECEKFVMAFFQPTYDQGIFGLVNNLGSLIVRTVFQPFEQAVFTAFSMSDTGSSSPGGGTNIAKQKQADLLTLIMKIVVIFGAFCVTFGSSYSYTLLYVSYGRKWAMTDAPKVLSIYCIYVFTMALNGVSEAFVHATADKEALKQVNYMLVFFSAMHSITSIALVKAFGTEGLVFAGCISMLLRIAYCYWYMNRYFSLSGSRFKPRLVLPSPTVVLAIVAAAVGLNAYEKMQIPDPTSPSTAALVRHLGVGVGVGLTLLWVVYAKEKDTFKSLVQLAKQTGGGEDAKAAKKKNA